MDHVFDVIDIYYRPLLHILKSQNEQRILLLPYELRKYGLEINYSPVAQLVRALH